MSARIYSARRAVPDVVRRSALPALMLALTLASIAAAAGLPPVDRVGFTPSAGALLPADARFLDENAQRVRLGDYWRARAAIIVPAYYGCSNLCTTVLHALAQAVVNSGLRAGRDVEIVVVSINPLDTPQAARAKKHDVLPDGARTGWHFLTGEAGSIDAIATALGYRYVYDAEQRQYAHAAGAAVVSTEGRVSRTLAGVEFSPASLRGALRAAGNSTIGQSNAVATQAVTADDNRAALAGAWLLCYHYDPRTGRYTFAAMNAVRLVAIVVLLALAAYVLRSRRAERRAARGS
jgi:protein SCO1